MFVNNSQSRRDMGLTTPDPSTYFMWELEVRQITDHVHRLCIFNLIGSHTIKTSYPSESCSPPITSIVTKIRLSFGGRRVWT